MVGLTIGLIGRRDCSHYVRIMRRISRDDLKRSIVIALRMVPNAVRRQYSSKLPLERDSGAEALAEVALNQLDSENRRTFAPDMVSAGDWGVKPGKWKD